MKSQIASGYDIVLVIYPGKDTFKERGELFSFLLERARLSIPLSK